MPNNNYWVVIHSCPMSNFTVSVGDKFYPMEDKFKTKEYIHYMSADANRDGKNKHNFNNSAGHIIMTIY